MKKTRTLPLIAALLGTSMLVACGQSTDSTTTASTEAPVAAETETMTETDMDTAPVAETTPMYDEKTIVTLASETADLSTLVAAVQAADLVDTLNGDGPFTVFAPANSAFDALPAGTVDTLLLPENKAMLSGILTYHVVPAEVMATDLIQAINDNGGAYEVATVNGGTITATLVDGGVVLTDATGGTAKVVATDVDASNGVVHVIDTVVMPE